MLALAQARVLDAGLGTRIALEHRHLPDDSLPTSHFDAVVCNSVLHHLADPQVLWTTIARVARPGARIAVGDLRRPTSATELAELVATHAADAPEVLREDYAHSLAAAYTLDEIAAQVQTAGLDLHVEATTDRHVLVTGVR